MKEETKINKQPKQQTDKAIPFDALVGAPPKRFIAFSGGIESSTLALIYGAVAKPIFADTGSEHEELYERIEKIENKLKQIHGEQFEIIRVSGGNLKDYIKKHKYFPSHGARYCTRLFKIEPMDKFLAEQGECELMIGFNADEASDRKGNFGLQKNVKYTYPLVDNGLTRQNCIELLKRANLEPLFPPYMRRGGCDICFYKSKKEWKALVNLNEKKAWELAEFEASIQSERKDYFAINKDLGKLSDFIKAVKQQGELFDMKETYPSYEDNHSPCGAFCHR